MKSIKLLLALSIVALSLSACLKDKSEEAAAPEQTMEQTEAAPMDAAPEATTEEAAPEDSGETQSN